MSSSRAPLPSRGVVEAFSDDCEDLIQRAHELFAEFSLAQLNRLQLLTRPLVHCARVTDTRWREEHEIDDHKR